MAAVFACDLDNLIIEINGNEVPIMDGSSKLFINEINKAGIKELDYNRKFLKIKKKVKIIDNDKYIIAEPNNDFLIDLKVKYNYGKIGEQRFYWSSKSNSKELFNCRTFCNKKEIDYMKSIGLAKGGSLDNAMVFDEDGIINKDGFICENEVVKHKMLDLIGDLMTSGYYIKGKFTASKTGHLLNNKFLNMLFKDINNFIIEE